MHPNSLSCPRVRVQLKLQSPDGKYYRNRFSQTPKSLFRSIQSICSKKAEPFKRWLAKVGYERVQEIEGLELAQKRVKEIYNQKEYSDECAREDGQGNCSTRWINLRGSIGNVRSSGMSLIADDASVPAYHYMQVPGCGDRSGIMKRLCTM